MLIQRPPTLKESQWVKALRTFSLPQGTLIAPVALGIAQRLRHFVTQAPWDTKERWIQLLIASVMGAISWEVLWLIGGMRLLGYAWSALLHDQLLPIIIFLLLIWLLSQILLAPAVALAELLQKRQWPQEQQTPEASQSPTYPENPEGIDGSMVLGTAIQGDLFAWLRRSWLVYPLKALNTHAIVVGRSGAGKSETLLRIAVLAAKLYGMKVIFVDGKGDWEMMARFITHMRDAGLASIGAFPVGTHNGWLGTPQDLLNRLLESQSFSEDYYRGIATNMLSMAINAPGKQPPKNSEELLERLNLTKLKQLYKGTPQYQELQALQSNAAWGVYYRYASFFRAIRGKLDGTEGFGTWDAAYYLLDGVRLEDESARLGQYLIKDFEQYMAIRKMTGATRRVLFILDEFSAISGRANATNLFERIRSLGGSVIVSSQSHEGLGEYADRMVATASTLILHACVLPMKLIEAAGTLWTADYSVMLDESAETGDAVRGKRGKQEAEHQHTTFQARQQEADPRISIHQRQENRVQLSDVQQLPVGQIFVIHGGRSYKVAVPMLAHNATHIKLLETDLYQRYQQSEEQSEVTEKRSPLSPEATTESQKNDTIPSTKAAPGVIVHSLDDL